jgi:hypothetical protein
VRDEEVPMTDEEKLAFEEGRLAATVADDPIHCPYANGTPEHAAWHEGYGYVDDAGRTGEPND